MTIVPSTPHITMKCQNSMDLESPDRNWLTPYRKAASITEQMTYLRTGRPLGVICPLTTKG